MESAISGVKFSVAPSPSIFNNNNQVSRPAFFCSLPVQNFQKEKRGCSLRVECGATGANSEEDITGMKKLMINECCREGDDIVELLECLEKEAIMGDDKGRDPNDYNRRAQIFDKSSKVFQALKNSQNTSSV